MKPYIVSSASQPSSARPDSPHQGRPSQSAITSKTAHTSKAAHARLIRTLSELTELAAFPPFIFASQVMLDLIVAIDLARDSRASVLITGETGTGKELIVRAIYLLSNRRERKFIIVNCAAMPTDLVESMLFGHVKGAFTGAVESKIGYCEAAEGGTLFLDEIGELPLDVQPKLLRFLQDGELQPVGAAESIKTDVHVIAVTNRNLEEEVRAGRFRADLFYRLNIFRLHIPPLRDRREEIPHLAAHFLKSYQQRVSRKGLQFSDEAIEVLCNYDWPGNVRQLEHEVHRLVLRSSNYEVIGPDRLTPQIRTCASTPPTSILSTDEGRIVLDPSLSYHQAIQETRRQVILRELKKTNGNLQQTAAIMKISRIALRKAIKKLGIEVKRS